MPVFTIPCGSGLDQSDVKYCGNPRFVKFHGLRVVSPNQAVPSPGWARISQLETSISVPYGHSSEMLPYACVGTQVVGDIDSRRYIGGIAYTSGGSEWKCLADDAILPQIDAVSRVQVNNSGANTVQTECYTAHCASDSTGYILASCESDLSVRFFRYTDKNEYVAQLPTINNAFACAVNGVWPQQIFVVEQGSTTGVKYTIRQWDDATGTFMVKYTIDNETLLNGTAHEIQYALSDIRCVYANGVYYVQMARPDVGQTIVATYSVFGASLIRTGYYSTTYVGALGEGGLFCEYRNTGTPQIWQSTLSSTCVQTVTNVSTITAIAAGYMECVSVNYEGLAVNLITITVIGSGTNFYMDHPSSTIRQVQFVPDIYPTSHFFRFYGNNRDIYIAMRKKDGPIGQVEIMQFSMSSSSSPYCTLKAAGAVVQGQAESVKLNGRPEVLYGLAETRTGQREVLRMPLPISWLSSDSAFTGKQLAGVIELNKSAREFCHVNSITKKNDSAVLGGLTPVSISNGITLAGLSCRPAAPVISHDVGTGALSGTHKYCLVYEYRSIFGGTSLGFPGPEVSYYSGTPHVNNLSVPGICLDLLPLNRSIRVTIYRTVASGTVYYDTGKQLILNPATGNLEATDDVTDALLVANRKLYCQGSAGYISGVAPNWGTPAHSAGWIGKDRMIVGGLEEPHVVQLSKLFVQGESISWTHPSAKQWRISLNEKVRAVAALDEAYLVFSEGRTYAIFGQGPDDTTYGQGVFDPPKKLSERYGAISQASVVEGDKGIYFQTQTGQIALVTRGSYAVQIVSWRAQEELGGYSDEWRLLRPVVAAHKTDDGLIYFVTNRKTIIYDEGRDVWVTDCDDYYMYGSAVGGGMMSISGPEQVSVSPPVSAIVQRTAPVVLKYDNGAYVEVFSKEMTAASNQSATITTSYISPGGLCAQGAVRTVGVFGGRKDGGWACPPEPSPNELPISIYLSQDRGAFSSPIDAVMSTSSIVTAGNQSGRVINILPDQQKCGNFAIKAVVTSGLTALYDIVMEMDQTKGSLELASFEGRN